MGLDVGTIALLGLGASAVGTAVGYYQSKQAAAHQKKAMEAQQRASDMRAARERIEQVRRSRIARAAVLANAAQTGTSGSSGVAGGVGSLQSQTASNIGFSFAQQGLGKVATSNNVAAAGHQSTANMWQAFGDLGRTLTANSQRVSSIFSPGSTSNEFIFSGAGGPKTSFNSTDIF